MIDFTNLPRRNKTYGGANGSKRSVIYAEVYAASVQEQGHELCQ